MMFSNLQAKKHNGDHVGARPKETEEVKEWPKVSETKLNTYLHDLTKRDKNVNVRDWEWIKGHICCIIYSKWLKNMHQIMQHSN